MERFGKVMAQTLEDCSPKTVTSVTCDQEVWVRDRILTAIRMAIVVNKEKFVGADQLIRDYALNGIAEGAAVEIISTLGLQNIYVNIPDLRSSKQLG